MADDDPPKRYVLPLQFTASRYGTRNLPAPLVERYTQMQTKIAELVKALAELPQIPAQPAPTGGMGHNNPPEPLEPADIDEIKADIQVLKTQTASPSDKGAEAVQAVLRIEAKASKLRQWVERRGEELASEVTKGVGKQIGTWTTTGFALWLADQLLDLSKFVHVWLEAVARHLP
jgi:hypothetical protein